MLVLQRHLISSPDKLFLRIPFLKPCTMRRNITIEIISTLLTILFVYAAVSKILDYDKFQIQLSKSPMLTSFSTIAAVGVPTIEILISVALMIRGMRKWGLYASLFLLVAFTSYLIILLNFSYYIPCSCGGILQNMSWQTHVWFNLSFIALTLIAIYYQERRSKSYSRNSNNIADQQTGVAENL
jgi:hypothetical protein